MSGADDFFDTSALLYLLSADEAKSTRAEALLAEGGVISVQVLNEFAAVAIRKFDMPLADLREVLSTLRSVTRVEPLTEESHDRALAIVERYGFSVFDSMIIAVALMSGCRSLYSEDLQHNQVIDRQLRIVNPFRST